MKKFVVFLMVCAFALTGSFAFAAKGGKKGPSEEAYEHANEHARFKRDQDWQPGEKGKKGKKKHHKKHKKNKSKKQSKKADDKAQSSTPSDTTTP